MSPERHGSGDQEPGSSQAPQAPGSSALGSSSAGAPPLGTRPAEPAPGKESLEDPQGRKAASGAASDEGPVCPDCGLAFRDHPDFAGRHDRAHGHGQQGGHGGGAREPTSSEPEFAAGQRHAPFDPRDAPGSPSDNETRLPGEELDQRDLGGDPAGS